MQDQVLTSVISKLYAAFGRQLSPHALEAYREALEDLTDEELLRAGNTCLKRSRYLPAPAELREAALGRGADRALLALASTERAARGLGGYVSVDFEDRRINAAIRALGGWPAVCQCPADEWRSCRARDFRRAYEAYADRDPGLAGDYLPGLAEIANLARGDRPDPPRQIPCPELVRRPMLEASL